MATAKSFFSDRTILLFLSVETFLTLFIPILIMLKLSAAGDKVTFLSQFRSLPNATDFATGGVGINGTVWDITSFIVATIIMYVVSIVLAHRVYAIRREFAVVVLVITFTVLMFILAISNILLVLR